VMYLPQLSIFQSAQQHMNITARRQLDGDSTP